MDNIVANNVFIDSSIYIARNFQFNDQLFGRIAWLSKEGIVRLFISEIVKKEVIRNIESSLKEAEASINSLKNRCRILRLIPDYRPLYNANTLTNAKNKIKNDFERFINETKAKIIPVDEISIENLLEKYFSRNPPFSEKKKYEFPDAINLLAIESWCIKNNQDMCIISSDNDIKNYCADKEILHYYSSIEEFLDHVTSIYEYKYNIIKHLFINNFEEGAVELIKEEFESLGFILDNEDGEVEFIEAYFVEIEDEDEVNITEISDDIATITFEARVWFNADVTYNDYENSLYDKEEGKYIYINTAERHIEEYDILLPVTIKVKFDVSNQRFEIIDCIVNENDDVSLTLYDEDYC